jgi:phospho-N-acetylmuramoyl-pentapeptide-transferase
MSNIVVMFSFSILSFIFWMLLIPKYIKGLVAFKMWQKIRKDATIWKASQFHKLHKDKEWTPTMGWLIILILVFAMVIASMLLQWFDFVNHSLFNRNETYLSLFTLLSVWLLGTIDDIMNIKHIGKKGMSVKFKFIWITLFALAWALWFYYKLWWSWHLLNLSFLWQYQIWLWFIPLFIFVFVAITNSVNITDWLDWLAWWLLLLCYWAYAFITYDKWMFLLSTLCVTIIWVMIAFLWFNVKPAKFYLWDVGSLALGANLWVMAMLTNTMLVFIIISLIFIWNTITVIVQLLSKKFRKKKIFRIAPFHHHLEALWWAEETIVFRFWMIQIMLTVVGIIVYSL